MIEFATTHQTTERQVDHFRRLGFLRLGCRLSERTLIVLRNQFEADMDRFGRPDSGGRRIDDIVSRSRVWMELAQSPPILESLEPLLGPNILFLLNRHNHATWTVRGTSSRLHRDVLQWSRTAISVIVYLEEATLENGCTEIIPGSNYLPFVGTPNNGGTWMDEHSIYRDLLEQAVALPMPPGGILAFDATCFHRAGINRTSGCRPAITLAYAAADELAQNSIQGRIVVRGTDLYRGNPFRSPVDLANPEASGEFQAFDHA